MRYYLVIGQRNGGYNKEDNWPWMKTTNEEKAKKALQYMKGQEPEYAWRIVLKEEHLSRRGSR